MGFRAFTEAFRDVLVQLGEGADAEDFTFNSLRRFMPTLANFLHLDPQQAQAVGHWQEVAQFPMSERYAGVKHLVSGRVQLSILAIFFHMVKLAVDAFDIRPPVNWNSGLLTCAHLEPFRLSAEEVDRLLEGLGAAVESGFSDYPFHSADVITQLCDPSQEPATCRKEIPSLLQSVRVSFLRRFLRSSLVAQIFRPLPLAFLGMNVEAMSPRSLAAWVAGLRERILAAILAFEAGNTGPRPSTSSGQGRDLLHRYPSRTVVVAVSRVLTRVRAFASAWGSVTAGCDPTAGDPTVDTGADPATIMGTGRLRILTPE